MKYVYIIVLKNNKFNLFKSTVFMYFGIKLEFCFAFSVCFLNYFVKRYWNIVAIFGI